MTDKRIIDVCAAVIQRGGAFLLALRPEGKHLAGHWEFPGGKVSDGETLEVCIQREIEEELGVIVSHPQPIHMLEHNYPEKTIRLHFLICSLPEDSIPSALEHEDIAWVRPGEAEKLNLAPADRRFLEFWKE